VTAAGIVRAAGGVPNAAFVNPGDLTTLQLATDANDRPLIGTTEGGMAATVAGMTLWPTPAVPAATAVIAEADQIVVTVREDASVAVSDQFAFNADGTVVRVVARVDVRVNDPDGLMRHQGDDGNAGGEEVLTRAGQGHGRPRPNCRARCRALTPERRKPCALQGLR
jgi:Phage capsid family